MPICSCIICRKEFSHKGIFTHVERTHNKSQKYSSGNNGKYKSEEYLNNLKLGQKFRFNNKLGELKNFNVICFKCKTPFIVEERESKFPSREKYYCSRSCANSREVSEEQKIKTSETLTGKTYIKPIEIISVCENCEQEFSYIRKHKHNTIIKPKRFCSISCSARFRNKLKRKNRSEFLNYSADCSFKFNVFDYPEEFDLFLIEEYGWYKAKNRGDNLNGISRDHMISVRYGFDNNIPTEHISHPANCKLMQHSNNSSKNIKCSISYEELLEKIEKWNKKYIRV
jgi:hypothetical protein